LWTFAAVGFSGVFVNLGMLFLFADVIGLAATLSSAIAIEISIVWNFLLNNRLTFRDRNASAQAGFLERMFRYNLVGLAGLAVQLGTFVLLTWLVMRLLHLAEPGIWKYPAQLVGIGLGMAVNFATNFYWTWQQRESEPPPPLPRGEEA
jgi:dolichol-phosphate mannosyltransferase